MSFTLHSELCVLVRYVVVEGDNEIQVSNCRVLLLFLFCRQLDHVSTDSCLG